jgi:hypothetical protein
VTMDLDHQGRLMAIALFYPTRYFPLVPSLGKKNELQLHN